MLPPCAPRHGSGCGGWASARWAGCWHGLGCGGNPVPIAALPLSQRGAPGAGSLQGGAAEQPRTSGRQARGGRGTGRQPGPQGAGAPFLRLFAEDPLRLFADNQ